MTEQTLFLERLETPTGPMRMLSDAQGRLRALDWDDHETRMTTLLRRHYGAAFRIRDAAKPSAAHAALDAYFDGDLTAVDGLPTVTNGTAFQRLVWDELRRIPAGESISYGTLAGRIGRSGASRAVGLANGANPIAIVVPCHRVIGADASLTGYGGGLERKRWLLAHEKARRAPASQSKATMRPVVSR